MRFKLSEFKYWPQILALLILLGAYAAYRYFAYYDTRSNDSYVSANVVNIAALVSGPITKLYVQDNQRVKKGDKLFTIDTLPYEYAVQQAKAKLNLQSNEYEQLAAKAELDKANYLLSHTTLTAPEDGYVSNVHLSIGQYIKAGETLFALIETRKWWVETRYRETALRLIKLGDKAKIKIDMYPGKVFHGHVQSIGWGISRAPTSSTSSSLIYIQPTEDWIQISQRFPVRISIDDLTNEYPMRIGASATTTTYR